MIIHVYDNSSNINIIHVPPFSLLRRLHFHCQQRCRHHLRTLWAVQAQLMSQSLISLDNSDPAKAECLIFSTCIYFTGYATSMYIKKHSKTIKCENEELGTKLFSLFIIYNKMHAFKIYFNLFATKLKYSFETIFKAEI